MSDLGTWTIVVILLLAGGTFVWLVTRNTNTPPFPHGDNDDEKYD